MEIRHVGKLDLALAVRVFEVSLGEDFDDTGRAAFRGYVERGTTTGAWVDGRLVGTASAFAAELTVPGGNSVPVHAITGVGVLPTHARRGYGSALMAGQFADARADGVVACVLEASEATIYGRYGFGPATTHANAVLQAEHAAFRVDLDDDGHFDYAEGDAIPHYGQPLHEAWRRSVPGQLSRPANTWALYMVDPPAWRGGGGERIWVFHVDASGAPDGYVSYRIVPRSDGSLPANEAKVLDLVSPDPHVRALLLRFVIDQSLVTYVNIDGLGQDDPLEHLLVDPRRLRVAETRDGLWVRLLDIPTALQARRWWHDDELVLEVGAPDEDDATTWRLVTRDGRAEVERADDATPDLSLGIDDLGMLWLGGVSARALAGAGRVVPTSPDVLSRATHLFRGEVMPNHVGEF